MAGEKSAVCKYQSIRFQVPDCDCLIERATCQTTSITAPRHGVNLWEEDHVIPADHTHHITYFRLVSGVLLASFVAFKMRLHLLEIRHPLCARAAPTSLATWVGGDVFGNHAHMTCVVQARDQIVTFSVRRELRFQIFLRRRSNC